MMEFHFRARTPTKYGHIITKIPKLHTRFCFHLPSLGEGSRLRETETKKNGVSGQDAAGGLDDERSVTYSPIKDK